MKDRPAIRLAGPDNAEKSHLKPLCTRPDCGVRWLALRWGARCRGTRLTDIDGNLCPRQASDLKQWEVCRIRKQGQEAVCSFFVRQKV